MLVIRAHTQLRITCPEADAWVRKFGLDSTVLVLSIFHPHLYTLGAMPVVTIYYAIVALLHLIILSLWLIRLLALQLSLTSIGKFLCT